MFATPLRFLSIFCSAVVLLSLGGFAIDQARAGSNESQAGIARSGEQVDSEDAASYAKPTPAEEKARETANSSVREVLDDANDVVIAPFASIGDGSDSGWGRRGIPALIALLVYGFGFGFLARFATGRG
ncbi:hypothetical protein DSM112329_05307 [Paraconexibacter sp. AEG42_29]|uniref:Uncharacterized protein n=1 Tax=Paraconexibacter sp. AEG42_29 TaxID=2997339 RepID=A0AAU7B3G4_9ACTN